MQNNRSTLFFKNKPMIIGNYSTVGSKEGHGNFSKYFHCVLDDDKFGEKTFEKAERKILEHTLNHAVKSANLTMDDINVLVCGDLLNQIISSTFAARKFGVPYLGLYGACSTMTEGLTLSAMLVDGKYVKNVLCGTGTHFSSAERQYRNPLELGNQRPQTSQWTITGAGASVISLEGVGHYIVSATIGKVVDYDVKDVNNEWKKCSDIDNNETDCYSYKVLKRESFIIDMANKTLYETNYNVYGNVGYGPITLKYQE